MKSLIDWFDPSNKEHLTAYKELQNTGYWPEGFRPIEVRVPVGWPYLLASKIADYYVNKTLKEN